MLEIICMIYFNGVILDKCDRWRPTPPPQSYSAAQYPDGKIINRKPKKRKRRK